MFLCIVSSTSMYCAMGVPVYCVVRVCAVQWVSLCIVCSASVYTYTRLPSSSGGTIHFCEDTPVNSTNWDISLILFHRIMGTPTNLTHTLYFLISKGHGSRLI